MCDLSRKRRRVPGVGLLLAGVLLTSGACSEQRVGQDPPPDKLYFPVNMEISDQRFLYLLNSNFDQRYNAGWIQAVDLQKVTPDGFEDAWLGQLKILSLGGDLALDRLEDPRKLMVTHRGSGAVTEIDLNFTGETPELTCGDVAAGGDRTFPEEQTDCDPGRILYLAEALGETSLSAEEVRDPYGVTFFEGPGGLSLGLGFLNLDQIVTFDIEEESAVWLTSATVTDLEGTAGTGSESLVSIPGQPGVLLATGKGRASLYTLDLEYEAGVEPVVDHFGVGTGAELVDLVFSETDPATAYVVTNRPGAVLSMKVTWEAEEVLLEDGAYVREDHPLFRVQSAIPLPGRPTGLARLSSTAGDLLFVAGFDDDEVFVIGTEGPSMRVVRRLGTENGVGKGPFSVAAVDCGSWPGASVGCARLVVGNFLGESATVFDVSSGDVDEFKKIAVIQ